MASIDERVVAMSFENKVFEQRVAQTMATLTKLNTELAKVGKTSGFADIEKAAQKVTLQTPMSALDKLKTRLFGASQGAAEGFSGIDAAGNKVTLQGPTTALDKLRFRLAGASQGAAEGMAGIDAAGNRVRLDGPLTALDRLRSRLFGVSTGASEGFSGIERASNIVQLLNPLTAIDRLRARLGGVGAGASTGFNEIERASGKVTLGGISTAIGEVQKGFSGLQAFAIGAVGGLVAGVTLKAKGMVNALSLGPITQGLEEYSTNLNSIQTILSNTKASGANLKDVNKALQELNHYSDQTIYNFSQMAKNIGTFTAAGVDLETAVGSIKGIANLAALSGSNSEQASTAMYQLSQAIAAGRVSLQDWNSVVNAGMGGTVFQRSLAQTAVAMGTLSKGSVELKGKMKNVQIEGQSFRESITAKPGEKSWLTSKVLTTALKNFTGDMSEAQIVAQGFTKAQAKSIMEQARTAKNAATEVKTLKGVFDVAQESIGSGWAATFQLIFGDFEQAKKTFTSLSQALSKIIGDSADARNKVFGDWAKMGGRTAFIDGLKNAFNALLSVLKPIKEAFRDVFPRKTGEDLYAMTVRFRDFMKSLKIGPETADSLKRIFRGLFSVLNTGITIVKGIAGVIFDLLGTIGKGSGGVLSFAGNIGDLFYNFDQAVSKGKGFEGVFKSITKVLQTPMEMLKSIAGAIRDLFGGGSEGGGAKVKKDLDGVRGSLEPLAKALGKIIDVWEQFYDVVSKKVAPVLEKIKDVFSKIGDYILKGIEEINYDRVMEGLQTGLLAGLAVGIKKLMGGIGLDLSGGGIDAFKDVMGTLTKTLSAIQNNINARTMLLIAGAVLALAAATVIFAHIDPKKLLQATAGITVAIAQLSGAMLILAKSSASFYTLPFVAAGMILLAGAVVILGGAMHIMARLSWEEMIKGLAGVAGVLGGINLAIRGMGPSLLLVGPGLLAVSGAMVILATAMKIMGSLSWGEMIKGLIGIGGSLAALSLGLSGLGPTMLLVGPGLIAAAFGLILLAGAIRSFGGMSLWELAKGIGATAAALVVIGVALTAIPPTAALPAAGILVLAVALNGIAIAMGIMGSLGIATIAKGLIAMAGSLAIFAVGLTAMAGTAPGALALLGAAAALAILTPVLVTLGQLKIQTIAIGLGAIAAVMLVIAGVGAIAATPLTALGVALIAIGAGAVLAATAVYLVAKAIGILSGEGTKGVGVMVAAVTAFIALLPKMAIEFLKGLVQILESLVSLAPQIISSMVKIVDMVINGLIQIAPKIQSLMNTVIQTVIQVVNTNAGPLINAGYRLLLNFLNGLASNIGPITSAVSRIIVGFLGALASHMPRLIAAGGRALVSWLNGVAGQLPRILAAGARLVGTFLTGITQKLPGIVAKAAQLVSTLLNSIASRLPGVLSAGVRVIVTYIRGIANAVPRIISAGTNVIIRFVEGISRAIPRLVDAGFRAVIRLLNGIATAIRANDDKMINAGYNIAGAIGEGLLKGLTSIFGRVREKASSLIASLPSAFKKVLGIRSPSRVMMAIGTQTMQGLAVGITKSGREPVYAMSGVGNEVVSAASGAMGAMAAWNIPSNISHPVITPVLNLSKVEEEAKRLHALTRVGEIDPATSYYQANGIAQQLANDQTADAKPFSDPLQPMLRFEQNNYSPESLSATEIYRQTKNLVSQTKDALGMATP